MNISKMLYCWEQFKIEAGKALELYLEKGKSYVVFIPSLKTFEATCNPHPANEFSGSPADQVVMTFDDPLNDIHSYQNFSQYDLVNIFDNWYNYNCDKLED